MSSLLRYDLANLARCAQQLGQVFRTALVKRLYATNLGARVLIRVGE
jgi:hypothetical protein